MQKSSDLSLVQGYKYISLTTFRKSGEPVSTPIWFVEKGISIYVWTEKNSWKVKRLRHDSRVRVAPSTYRGRAVGPSVDGTARIVSPQAQEEIENLMAAKYGRMMRLASFLNRNKETVAVEINPDPVITDSVITDSTD